LLDAAGAFSPRVEETDEGVVTLDLDGVPARESEPDLARALVFAVGKAGLPARAGIAGSRLAALVAAGLPGPPTVVPPGEEARFLAPLPLERLDPELEVLATLSRWGIRS